MKTKNKKTFRNLFLALLAFVAIIFSFQKCNAQADTSYMQEIDGETNDTTCFMLVGEMKGEIDCNLIPENFKFNKSVTGGNSTEKKEVINLPEDKETKEVDFITVLKKVWEFILNNWYILILPILEFIVRVIPGEKDNNLLRILQSWLDQIIPNRKKGGGRFVAYDNKDSAPKIGIPVEAKEQ